jgi:DNA mismatch repair ATPase MutS
LKELADIYQNRIEDIQNQIQLLIKKKTIFSILRLCAFVGLLLVIYFFSLLNTILSVVLLLILMTVFGVFIKQFNSLKKQIKYSKILMKLNEDEVRALEGKTSQFHSGNEYINFDHPFSYDMDIFGDASLFAYLNRTTTIPGKNTLMNELSSVRKDKKQIELRQEAIKEFAPMIDFRQGFSSTSIFHEKNFKEVIQSTQDDVKIALEKWSGNTLHFIYKPIWRILLILLPTITFFLLLLAILDFLPYSIMWLSFFLNLSVIGSFLKRTNNEHQKLGKRTGSLLKVKELVKILELSEFKSVYAEKLRKQLLMNGSSFHRIQKLYKLLNAFDMRLNMIAGVLLNGFLLWDLQILKRLEKQKESMHQNLDGIFQTIGEFDALFSLANFSMNNPVYCFPTIRDDMFVFEMKNGGHPLIDNVSRVCNDFYVEGLNKMFIITGANMAGKSTFLRTIGVNMILASAGAPVCASEMVISPIQIFTSVRTNDSLQKNESYFYAELMRLKRIIDLLKSDETVFVIIDEMLKGTNSKDKHNGSYQLIKQLIRYKAVGLAATHDIELGKLADEFPDQISNKRFEVDIMNNELVFDYKLKDGISQNLNATFLMKKYGITD